MHGFEVLWKGLNLLFELVDPLRPAGVIGRTHPAYGNRRPRICSFPSDTRTVNKYSGFMDAPMFSSGRDVRSLFIGAEPNVVCGR
jgi:hypothetical protein